MKITIDILKKIIASRGGTVKGFDKVYNGIRVVSGGEGNLTCELDVTEDMLNMHQTLHGGMTATLVDVASSCAFGMVGNGNFGVSMDLNVSYLKPVFENETILIKATTLKCGRNIAMGTVEILNKATGEMVATGRHTKFVGEGKVKNDLQS